MALGDRLATHVEILCAENDIQMVERSSYGGVAFKRSRTIRIKPVKTQRTYIVALHEIGQVIGANRSGRRLEKEAAAWDFVLKQTIIPLSRASYAQMLKYLNSYLLRAQWSNRMTVPPREHRFWVTYRALQEGATGRITGVESRRRRAQKEFGLASASDEIPG